MQPLFSLILANLAFLVGPVVLKFLNKKRNTGMFLDGMTYASILSFCFLHVLPEVVEAKAYPLLIFFFLGLFFPLCPHYFQTRFGSQNKKSLSIGVWLIVTLGIALHVFAEGAVLASQHSLSQINLSLSVIVHRFGVSIVILNFFLKQNKSKFYGYASIALLIVGTTCGFFWGDFLGSHGKSQLMLIIEVFIAGNLLHFIKHSSVFSAHSHDHEDCGHHDCSHSHHHHHAPSQRKPFLTLFMSGPSFSSYGALTIVALLTTGLFYFGEEEAKAHFFSIVKILIHLFNESAFPLLLAYLFAGLFKSFIRPAHLDWLQKGNDLTKATKGVLFGLPLPICSCGVLPLYQSLITRGVPLTAATAFLIATPEIGLDAVFLSFALLGTNFTAIRLLAATILSFTAALTFTYFFKKRQVANAHKEPKVDMTLKDRLCEGMRYGFIDLVDHTIPWITMGLLLAALMEHSISYDIFKNFSSQQQVFLLAVVGIPLYVCASGATPLAAILLHKGVSAGAAIAFLLAGPATNVSTFGILSKLHGKKYAFLFGTGVLSIAILLGLFINSIDLPFDKLILENFNDTPSLFKKFCAFILGAFIFISFVRQGLRHFIDQLFGASLSH